jgi:diacylglycerol O-acyltransferase / wax synthase
MSYAHYERLSTLDASQLGLETRNVHMHIGGVSIYEAAPLQDAHGAFDVERIERYVASRLHRLPRYRQRLEATPVEAHPIWVDDERFNLRYHLRYASLPKPAGERELKRLVGRIISDPLDRAKPLWEMWFVEGLEGGRVAVVTKVHHCMVDGIAGASLMTALMRTDPDPTIDAVPAWIPRPHPSPWRLFADAAARRATLPLSVLRGLAGGLAEPRRALRDARDTLSGLRELLETQLHSATSTPLNVPIGPHRRLDWCRFELAALKEVRQRLGGTVNDLVLAVFAGAISRFLSRRGVDVAHAEFRALVPVSLRHPERDGASLGNRVAFLIAELPIDERSPVDRLRAVRDTMQRLKQSRVMRASDALEQVLDATLPSLFARFARIGSGGSSYNLVVTNVPGPQFPTYLLGARQLETYPFSPLFANQALTVTVFSYDGHLFWGFNSDWDALPDLHDLVTGVQESFEAFRKASLADAGRQGEEASA